MQTRHRTRSHGRRSARRPIVVSKAIVRRAVHHRIGVGVTALALVAGLSIAPTGPAQAATLPSTSHGPVQVYYVDAHVAAPPVKRDDSSATDGVQTLTTNATNADWAKLVMMFGGWPQSDNNVTVMLRWMRQENGPPDWWNRNNPLNNGYGSGGGAGLGSYPDLVTAAKYAAQNLQRGYPDIVAGFAASASPDVTAAAIWASPWSSSHYANGAHWSTSPVDVVQAPASAW
ncbi:hypothetical protein ACPPVQ_02865 [Diaminobutyricibacter sp. McL0618]|uniref:hypothetical protein n=1 Tax=Leifsonia sp. McL0618 TaxID=3415677 RepID=UPI003CF01C90